MSIVLTNPPTVPTSVKLMPSALTSTRTDSIEPISKIAKSGAESPEPVNRLLVN